MLRAAVRLVICIICSAFCLSTSVWGQVQNDWQVLRIFVPEEEVGSLVPIDYNPVEIEDLSEALAREASRRTQLQSTPHIAEALYVVRCNGENLVSDQSRWTIKSPLVNGALKLEEISVALRNSGSTPAEDKPLIPSLRYSTDGTTSLSKITGDANFWFGMSSVPSSSVGNQSIYNMRLPSATMARMLISAPESMQISSPDVIVTPISNPRDHLPESWPSLATAEGQRWFLVPLSGKSKFRLLTEMSERKDALDFQHFVRRSSLAYSASEKGLSVSADFEVERLSETGVLTVQLDKSLRIRAVTVNGASTSYQTVKTDDGVSAFEVNLNSLTSGNARLRIDAIADVVFPFDGVLPTVALHRAYSWEGRTSLVTEDALVGDQLVFANRPESTKPRLETTTIGKRWVADWVGVPPEIKASVGRVLPRCNSESFTRLTIQEDWISATTNLHIQCSAFESNELRLQIGQGWFIDDLTIEKSDLPITTHLPDGEAGDVILNWERLSGDMSIHVQVVAHLPKATNAEQFSLEAQRVVSVSGGLQRDHYAIEQTGRFQIQANPILQRLELSEADLPSWQKQLLSKLSVTQLFKGIGQSIPPIVMNRTVGTYNAKVITVARQTNGHLQATYSIEIQPTSGPIDSASCILSVPIEVDAPNWRITKEENGEQIPVAKAIVHATRDGPEQDGRKAIRFEFQLPDATSNKFVLQTDCLIPMPSLANVNLPLVTMPVATETWMILPRNLELLSAPVGVLALPVSVCCDSSEFAKSIEKDADSMVGYRYDPSIVSSVDLHSTSLKLGRSGWLWSDATEHRVYNDGNVSHQTILEIFAPENITLVITLPKRWMLNRVLLDGVVSDTGQQLDSGRALIQIPRGKQIHLELHASSKGEQLGWVSKVLFPKPKFSLATLNSSESVWLQPGRIATNEIFLSKPLSIVGRLTPTSWWKWIDPSPQESEWAATDEEGWRRILLHQKTDTRSIEASPLEANALVSNALRRDPDLDSAADVAVAEAILLDRSSLCALCVAILLAGSALSFWLLGDRITLWWVCITVALAVTLTVSSAYIGCAHLALQCFIGGALARLVRVITSARPQSVGLRRGSTIIRTGSNVALLLLVLSHGSISSAQESTSGKTNGKFPLTYGVLIPLNEDGELSAKHVYAPRKLMNLLNDSETQDREEQQPQILGAKYMLKISGGTSLTASYIQEFTAEFDLQFNSTEFALRLPFKSNQVQLLRGSVSGQAVFIGPRLQQTADAITYRPPETGRVRLRLQLIPVTSPVADRTGIEVEIPKIASSVLDVVADDTLDVNIRSIGSVRRLTSSSWSAELGPTDALRADWPSRLQRNPMPNQAVVQSDTWLHINEGQVVADCQIRINGARALPKQLHVSLDAGWEPVGTEWNDFKLISNELSPVGNRRIYLVNRETLNDRAVMRVLTVPRNGETVATLAVPFFSLSESSLTGRTLALSMSSKARWKLTGSEFWNRLNLASSDLEWDPGKPALTDLWRVPSGAVSGSIQRIPTEAVNVEESCELQLLSTKTTLDYRATWSQPTDAQVLKLEVPSDAEPRSVRINGTEAEYQMTERAARRFMLVNVAQVPIETRQLDIQLQLNRSSTEAARLPRIVLQDAPVARSIYLVSCGAELICKLTDARTSETESPLTFAQPVVDPTTMLSTLTSPVGVVDVASNYRDSTQLPVKYNVEKRAPANIAANAMALTRTEQGWRASVEVLLSAEQSTDFVFFDIPLAIRDTIESQGSPYRVTSSGAAGRLTLCLIPQPGENGQSRAKFAFRLPGLGSSQTISIPDVFILGTEVSRPVLALPQQIDDQPVRWLRAGRKLPDDWLSTSGLTFASNDYACFEMSELQQQVAWRFSEAESRPAEVLLAWAVIDEDNEGNTIGAVNYWIDPNNHLDVTLHLPKSARLIGIQSGTNGAVWHASKPDSIQILMQPNYLPVQLRVLLRWQKTDDASRESFTLKLPVLAAEGIKQMPIAVLSGAALESVEVDNDDGVVLQLDLRQHTTGTQIDAMLADRWRKLLLKSLPVVSDLRTDEFVGWVRNWSPNVAGLLASQTLNPQGSSGASNTTDAERDTVAGLWNWYLEQTTVPKAELRGADPRDIQKENEFSESGEIESEVASSLLTIDSSKPIASTMSGLPRENVEWFMIDSLNQEIGGEIVLKFAAKHSEQATASFAVAAAVLSVISGLLYLLFQRLRSRTNEMLAAHAWVYWSFLAALAWLLLPVAWPSIVIAINSFGILLAQMINSRRRQLAMRR